jgi:hypothetical protein
VVVSTGITRASTVVGPFLSILFVSNHSFFSCYWMRFGLDDPPFHNIKTVTKRYVGERRLDFQDKQLFGYLQGTLNFGRLGKRRSHERIRLGFVLYYPF